jgi:cytochrome P450
MIFDPLGAAFRADAGDVFARLHQTTTVLRQDFGDRSLVSIFSNDLGRWLLERDGEMTTMTSQGPKTTNDGVGGFSFLDPPAHTLLRRIVTPAFMGSALKGWQAQMLALNDSLFESLISSGGRLDFVADYADEFAAGALALFLGIPEHKDFIRKIGLATEECWGFGYWNAELGRIKNAELETLYSELESFWEGRWRQASRNAPGLMGALKSFQGQSEALSDTAAISLLAEVTGAGYVTVAISIANIIVLLAKHPEQYDHLRATPALIRNAIDESYRLESPLRFSTRRARIGIDVGDERIEPGDQLIIWLMACNQDPRAFESPRKFLLNRSSINHLVFGHGIHRCLGMTLARAQIDAMLTQFAAHVREFRVEHGVWQASRNPSPFLNRCEHLPIELTLR